MGESDSANTDDLLNDMGGCGRFQTILILLVNLMTIPSIMSYLIESFGMYNPGWRCLDDATTFSGTTLYNNTTQYYAATTTITHDIGFNERDATIIGLASGMVNTSTAATVVNFNFTYPMTNSSSGKNKNRTEASDFGKHSCKLYESCDRVEFMPDIITYVSEWGLTCDKGWIVSTVISIRMAGNLASTLVAGYIGDRYGRKLPLIVWGIMQFFLNLISIFSVNWQMYVVIAFLMGCFAPFGMLASVISFEYVIPEWRIKIGSIPIWSTASLLFASIAMATENWRYLRMITTGLGLIFIIPLFWIPNSLRWLAVKGKNKEVSDVIRKISRINKAEIPEMDKYIETFLVKKNEMPTKTKTYTILSLFRRKGYILPTVVVGLVALSIDMLYFVMSFGVISLPGNLYTNMMISSLTELPANLISFTLANLFRRKSSTMTLFSLTCACFFGIVAVELTASEAVRGVGTVSLVMLAKLLLFVGWIIFSTSINELYPTVVRSTVKSYISFTAAIGGVIAPYLIPTDPDTFYICYLTMGLLFTLCSALIVFIPETKDRPLQDVWEEAVGKGEGQGMTTIQKH